MKTGGGADGAAWEAEVSAMVRVSIPGYAMEITKTFDHWPSDGEVSDLAAAHVARHFPAPEVVMVDLRPGDVGTSAEEKALAAPEAPATV